MAYIRDFTVSKILLKSPRCQWVNQCCEHLLGLYSPLFKWTHALSRDLKVSRLQDFAKRIISFWNLQGVSEALLQQVFVGLTNDVWTNDEWNGWNACENIICKIGSILFRPQCVDKKEQRLCLWNMTVQSIWYEKLKFICEEKMMGKTQVMYKIGIQARNQ